MPGVVKEEGGVIEFFLQKLDRKKEYVGDPLSARNVLGSNNNELECDYKLKFIKNKKSTCNCFWTR